MGLFKKKADPISDRAKALSDEIAALEAKIKRLDQQIQQNPPRKASGLRSTALPDGRTIREIWSPQGFGMRKYGQH